MLILRCATRPIFCLGCIVLSSNGLVAQTASNKVSGETPVSVSSLRVKGLAIDHHLPASPDCWLTALDMIVERKDLILPEREAVRATSANIDQAEPLVDTMTCSWMTSEDQKVLALELSKCHMKDLSRPLFDFKDETEQNSCYEVLYNFTHDDPERYISYLQEIQGSASPVATNCLAHLTDKGIDTYTHFFSYVSELCTRLLSETIFGLYRQASHHLAKSSRIAEAKIATLIKHQDTLFYRWNERENQILQFHNDIESLIQQYSGGIKTEITNLYHTLEDERRLHSDRYEQYRQNLERELQTHRDDLRFFHDVAKNIQYLVYICSDGMKSIVGWFQSIRHLLHRVIWNLAWSLITYLLTNPRMFRWMRTYIFLMILMEFALENWFWLVTGYGSREYILLQAYFDSGDSIRSTSVRLIYNFYLIGMVFSCFFQCEFGTGHEESRTNSKEMDMQNVYMRTPTNHIESIVIAKRYVDLESQIRRSQEDVKDASKSLVSASPGNQSISEGAVLSRMPDQSTWDHSKSSIHQYMIPTNMVAPVTRAQFVPLNLNVVSPPTHNTKGDTSDFENAIDSIQLTKINPPRKKIGRQKRSFAGDTDQLQSLKRLRFE